MRKARCAICLFKNKNQQNQLECRKNPPQSTPILGMQQGPLGPRPVLQGVYTVWPLVAPDDWCGEFMVETSNGAANPGAGRGTLAELR